MIPAIALENKHSTGIVVPMYNEDQRWVEEYWRDVQKIPSVNLVFVNDGSTDGTRGILKNFANEFTNVSVMNLERNVGKSEAIRLGCLQFLNEKDKNFCWIGFIDGDGAFSAREILRILSIAFASTNDKTQEQNEILTIWTSRVALAGREIIRDPFRHYTSRILLTLIGFVLRQMPYDSQSGMKFFRNTDSFINVVSDPFRTRWFVDLEILIRMRALFKRRNFLREEPLEYWRDINGSKIKLKIFPQIFRDIVVILFLSLRDDKGRRANK